MATTTTTTTTIIIIIIIIKDYTRIILPNQGFPRMFVEKCH
jgi:hypothetical protein